MTDGITYNPGRQQPWTVWVRDEVVAFCAELTLAVLILEREKRQ